MPDADSAKDKKSLDRKARLAEQLRANLQKRKAQTRSRRIGEADSRPEGIDPGNKAEDTKAGGTTPAKA
ncbi:hypothetical protein MesoLjLc_66200 [Mesorhizobium sp. L-8-10]|uniref:hypothetical protein n=1 Tax=unclassified Mesorhizobium TaxID=325217 RepID=UPI0019283190|nr:MULTISPECIES: hypothetical protein [unclassified Mesorhizobium]BCH26721.1 hypothetical protein MesoLjLb_65060 [Mesorhizobium sp. L-8-3]BCH34690.1 hypothetical protein MesoLjLc_66200 [Mesorhizobium sp. L-8-10]